jgi:hypothetical protein
MSYDGDMRCDGRDGGMILAWAWIWRWHGVRFSSPYSNGGLRQCGRTVGDPIRAIPSPLHQVRSDCALRLEDW